MSAEPPPFSGRQPAAPYFKGFQEVRSKMRQELCIRRWVRGPAINAGDDHVIDHGYASHVIDHGEMSYDQAARYREYQSQPVFPSYETSGHDRSNCVHGHAELGREIFGWNIQHDQHATPQDLAEQMRGLRVDGYSSYRNGNDSDSE
ncbi:MULTISPECIES: hypothetical protein [Ralstonia solanacearum species complex]|uniref:hypothetical protein n=1 Tax=Ralstonia solanacearum species complex TaxID=3116862 RepID=UPI0002E65C77|nr:hypothetical protein [Ralstonia solanacearum]